MPEEEVEVVKLPPKLCRYCQRPMDDDTFAMHEECEDLLRGDAD